MANTRLSMRKIKDVLRLTHDTHLNTRQVALSLNISRSTVTRLSRAGSESGVVLAFARRLNRRGVGAEDCFRPPVSVEAPAKALPDFDYIYRELKAHKKFNLTLSRSYGWSTRKSILTATSTPSSASITGGG